MFSTPRPPVLEFFGMWSLFLSCAFDCDAAPVLLLPSAWTFPTDWKSGITDDAYQYSLDTAQQHSSQSAFFEGDIKGIDRVAERDHEGFYVSRNAIVDKSMRWKGGIVPYEISSSFNAEQKRLIEDALNDMMTKTCVRFTLRRSEPDYVTFVNRGLGCSSYVARTGGQQMIDLMPGCLTYLGEPQHEVMHALGFFHEQSRTDRDQFVTIVWSNLQTGAEDQFKVYRTDNLDMPYDYGSIMHYGWNYFAKDNRLPTIIPKTTQKVDLGTRKIMSAVDVEKINRLYECPSNGDTRQNPARGASPSPTPPATRPTVTTPIRTTTSTVARRLPPGPLPAWNIRPPGTPPSWNSG